MIRAFKYRLRPTGKQACAIERTLTLCRYLYNAALQERRDAWQKRGVSISRYDQQRSLTEIRTFDDEYRDGSLSAERSALRRIELAFAAYFRRCKNGEKPGYPRFKSADRYDSFDLDSNHITVTNSRVHVPKIGWVRLKLYRPLHGKSLSGKIKRQCGRWYVIFQQYLGAAPHKPPPSTHVGVDLGLSSLVTLSTGEKIDNPRFFKSGAAKLTQRHQRLSTKRRGSQSRARAKLLVAKAHAHVSNQRLDYASKTAKRLFSEYDLVAMENLDVRQLINKDDNRFAKSISDASWSILRHAFVCKAEEAGKHLVLVDPRGTTQRCSGCDRTVLKTLYERRHVCPDCGLNLDRDHNAALNIKALGLSVVAQQLQAAVPA